MRFIGSKVNLLPQLNGEINRYIDRTDTFCDLFAGTGAVGRYFKKNFSIIANDLLYFSYVLIKATIEPNEKPTFSKLKRALGVGPFVYFLNLDERSFEFRNKPIFYENYSPNGTVPRQYFTPDNALRIDAIRQTIESWKSHELINETEYYYLIAGLIEAVPFVSNIAGTYGAFLKRWDKRSFKKLNLVQLPIENNFRINQCFNNDANKLIRKIEGGILYIDPPYNQRQYISNYHILETVAKYDYPQIRGITGTRSDSYALSKYCRKREVFNCFDDLISHAKFKVIMISYSSEGLLTEDEILSSLENHCRKSSVRVKRIPYRRYKRISSDTPNQLNEFIFTATK